MEMKGYKKERTLITWFSVRDLCRFPTKGKEQCEGTNYFGICKHFNFSTPLPFIVMNAKYAPKV